MTARQFLIIYAHPDPQSFNAAIKDTVIATLKEANTKYQLIDLYALNYNPVMNLLEVKGTISEETKAHQALIKDATNIVFIFPVWWFRAPAMLEGFCDKTFTPGFAYRFKPLVGVYGMPVPLLKDKRVLTIITHGAPALPVKLFYVNAVKYRFLLGFLSFSFSLWKCKIVQLWSVPFVTKEKREKYLRKVKKVLSQQ